MKLSKTLMRQLLLYGIIGGGSALLDLLLFTMLYKKCGINEYIANGISVHAGIVMSFVLNRSYNFKKTDKLLLRAVLFYLTGLCGLALSQVLLFLGGLLALPAVMTKFISIFIVAMVQFVINKWITFNQ